MILDFAFLLSPIHYFCCILSEKQRNVLFNFCACGFYVILHTIMRHATDETFAAAISLCFTLLFYSVLLLTFLRISFFVVWRLDLFTPSLRQKSSLTIFQFLICIAFQFILFIFIVLLFGNAFGYIYEFSNFLHAIIVENGRSGRNIRIIDTAAVLVNNVNGHFLAATPIEGAQPAQPAQLPLTMIEAAIQVLPTYVYKKSLYFSLYHINDYKLMEVVRNDDADTNIYTSDFGKSLTSPGASKVTPLKLLEVKWGQVKGPEPNPWVGTYFTDGGFSSGMNAVFGKGEAINLIMLMDALVQQAIINAQAGLTQTVYVPSASNIITVLENLRLNIDLLDRNLLGPDQQSKLLSDIKEYIQLSQVSNRSQQLRTSLQVLTVLKVEKYILNQVVGPFLKSQYGITDEELPSIDGSWGAEMEVIDFTNKHYLLSRLEAINNL